MVIHRGTCYSGHYYGYIKDVDHIGTWTRPATPPVRLIEKNSLDFFVVFQPKSSGKQKSANTRNGSTSTTPSRNTRNNNPAEPVESEEEINKKIELLRTILLSCDDWLTVDDLLKVGR